MSLRGALMLALGLGCGGALPPHTRGRDVIIAVPPRFDGGCPVACASVAQRGEQVAACATASSAIDMPAPERGWLVCTLVAAPAVR